jgi:hypothetical protein
LFWFADVERDLFSKLVFKCITCFLLHAISDVSTHAFTVTHEWLASTGLTFVQIVEFLLDEFIDVRIHKAFGLVKTYDTLVVSFDTLLASI